MKYECCSNLSKSFRKKRNNINVLAYVYTCKIRQRLKISEKNFFNIKNIYLYITSQVLSISLDANNDHIRFKIKTINGCVVVKIKKTSKNKRHTPTS
jgi:hypothetical protein